MLNKWKKDYLFELFINKQNSGFVIFEGYFL